MDERTQAPGPIFDYGKLPANVAKRVREAAGVFAHRPANAAEVATVGRILLVAKQVIGHGAFRSWCETESNWSRETISILMRVARRFLEIENAKLLHFDLTAIYHLSRDLVPDEARTIALQAVDRGERVSYTRAIEIANQFRADPRNKEQAPPDPQFHSPSLISRIFDAGYDSIYLALLPDAENGDATVFGEAIHRDTGRRKSFTRDHADLVLSALADSEPTKICPRCGVVKGLGDFSRRSMRVVGRDSACKVCERKRLTKLKRAKAGANN